MLLAHNAVPGVLLFAMSAPDLGGSDVHEGIPNLSLGLSAEIPRFTLESGGSRVVNDSRRREDVCALAPGLPSEPSQSQAVNE